jgi:hypothetical protein
MAANSLAIRVGHPFFRLVIAPVVLMQLREVIECAGTVFVHAATSPVASKLA